MIPSAGPMAFNDQAHGTGIYISEHREQPYLMLLVAPWSPVKTLLLPQNQEQRHLLPGQEIAVRAVPGSCRASEGWHAELLLGCHSEALGC